jgi:cytochrome P450
MFMGSANHDAEVFEDPERFDIRRPNAKSHLTFGYGPHACLGSPLARTEIKLFLSELTRRLPHMRLVEDQEFEYIPTISARAPRSILVEWDPHSNPMQADRPGPSGPART